MKAAAEAPQKQICAKVTRAQCPVCSSRCSLCWPGATWLIGTGSSDEVICYGGRDGRWWEQGPCSLLSPCWRHRVDSLGLVWTVPHAGGGGDERVRGLPRSGNARQPVLCWEVWKRNGSAVEGLSPPLLLFPQRIMAGCLVGPVWTLN